ncbi:hypothetical protein GCM10009675_35080 [Prauserella alba]|uniref:Uncharacterized protein n=1 Tax=Prauserella alba TaxID=176898 RepID=A0ABP4G5J7_9PSEU
MLCGTALPVTSIRGAAIRVGARGVLLAGVIGGRWNNVGSAAGIHPASFAEPESRVNGHAGAAARVRHGRNGAVVAAIALWLPRRKIVR